MSTPEATLQIVSTIVVMRQGTRFWRVKMGRPERGDGVVSVYGEDTYQKQIAPRLGDLWTLDEIYALED